MNGNLFEKRIFVDTNKGEIVLGFGWALNSVRDVLVRREDTEGHVKAREEIEIVILNQGMPKTGSHHQRLGGRTQQILPRSSQGGPTLLTP